MYSIFPVPRHITVSSGTVDLSTSEWILVDPSLAPALFPHLLRFSRECRICSRRGLTVSAGQLERGRAWLTVRRSVSGGGPEDYRLTCGRKGILLEAAAEAGAFYGLMTLRQIADQAGPRLRRFTVKDSPDFPNRGFMLDISRCKVPTMETLFRLIDTLASLKMNQLQLYTEHTFAYSAHETVWHDASPLTGEEIMELDAYCRERFIELVPNQNSFGHFERWLRHPAYRHLAECPEGFTHPLDPGLHSPWGSVLKPDGESLRFLDSLYGELLPNFQSRHFNVGCDETWELGRGASREQCEKRGVHRVFFDHLLRINQLTQNHGRRMMFWADIVLEKPELVEQLPADITALNWGYEAGHPFARETAVLARAGVPFYVCPGTSSWNSLIGRAGTAAANCRHAARHGLKNGAIGLLLTDWGDQGHHQPWPVSVPGLLAGAGCAWCLKANHRSDIPEAADRLIFRDQSGILGRLCYDLGRVHETVPVRIPNNTVFNVLFFRDNPLELMPGLRPRHLYRSLHRLERLASRLTLARPAGEEGKMFRVELDFAMALARYACHYGLFLLQEREAPGRAALKNELQRIIGQHARVWLLRNRPGGLHESSEILRRRMEVWEEHTAVHPSTGLS